MKERFEQWLLEQPSFSKEISGSALCAFVALVLGGVTLIAVEGKTGFPEVVFWNLGIFSMAVSVLAAVIAVGFMVLERFRLLCRRRHVDIAAAKVEFGERYK